MDFDKHGFAFVKIIMVHDFASRLRIPSAFVSKFRQYLPEKATLEIENLPGKLWIVKIEQTDNDVWLTGPGWAYFVQENNLKVPDFVVFRFIEDSRIQVFIFEGSGCTKMSESRQRTTAAPTSSSEESDDNYREDLAESSLFRSNKTTTSFTFKWRKYMKGSMPIKTSVCNKLGLRTKHSVKLRNMRGEEHQVSLYHHYSDNRVGFGYGWAAFVEATKFVLDQNYKFEVIHSRSRDEIIFQLSLI